MVESAVLNKKEETENARAAIYSCVSASDGTVMAVSSDQCARQTPARTWSSARRQREATERCQRAVLALERERGHLSEDARAKDGRLEAIRDRHGLLVPVLAAAAGAGALLRAAGRSIARAEGWIRDKGW